jgi:chaperonin GroES
MNLRPLNSNVHVRFLKEAEQTAGGIYLPDSLRDNWQTGEVLAVGPGYALPESDLRSVGYVGEGDVVLFYQHGLQLLAQGADEAIVAEEKLIAVEHFGSLVPLNDWVRLDVIAREESTIGQIIIPEEFRQRANLGRILSHGPGYLRLTGPYYGSRKSVPGIMGLRSDQVVGSLVYWSDAAECLEAGREGVEAVFVRAGDLLILDAGDENGEA